MGESISVLTRSESRDYTAHAGAYRGLGGISVGFANLPRLEIATVIEPEVPDRFTDIEEAPIRTTKDRMHWRDGEKHSGDKAKR